MNKSIFRHKLYRNFAALAVFCIAVSSCNEYKEDGTETRTVSHRLSLNMPLNIKDATLTEGTAEPFSYTQLRAHETPEHLVCRLLLEKKKLRQVAQREND